MRRTLALVLAPLVLLTLVACGDGEDDPSAEPAAEDRGSSADDAFPVTIEHRHGTTTLEERPERVVTLNVQWTDALLALDVEPAAYVLDAANQETEPYPWQTGLLDGSTRIDSNGQLPYEAIAAERPDLILATFAAADAEVYEQLSGIAPTIGLLGDLQVDPWQDLVAVAGRALGEQEAAEAVVAEVEGEVEALAEDLPGLAGTDYAMANIVPGDGIYVVADPEDGASRLFYGLGMEIDPDLLALDEGAVGRVEISMERIDLLDSDFLGVLTNGADPDELPGWSNLPAVLADTVVDFEFADVVGLNTPTPLSVPHVMELMRPALERLAATAGR